jgi:anti-sigma regulatory factor (Ser/Thr protein kinase)
MPSDLSLVVQVVKNLVNTTMPMEDKSKYQVIVGLNEIINNAIEHGNLGITFQEKSEAFKNSSFFELAIERAHQSPYNGREVHIWAQAFPSQGRVEFKVEDQGSGFDWRNLPNPREDANVLKHHGRGILIAEYAFDQVKFNEKGNCVTLVYKIPASQYQKSNICRI